MEKKIILILLLLLSVFVLTGWKIVSINWKRRNGRMGTSYYRNQV